MKRLVPVLVFLWIFAGVATAHAETPAMPHFAKESPHYRTALTAEQLAVEAMFNTAADAQMFKAQASPKQDITTKAIINIYGSVYNNQGAALCGLVLANGQFMFSCAPNGSYSLDVPTDNLGQVTLFGFVDGHFPYKRVFNGFPGRYDMTINVATSTPPPPPPVTTSTITFVITDGCNNGIQISYKFYDVDNDLVWPSATTHYVTQFYNASYTHNLSCRTGAKICYGARSVNYYWGIDVDGSKSCSDCCIFCQQGNSLSRRLTC